MPRPIATGSTSTWRRAGLRRRCAGEPWRGSACPSRSTSPVTGSWTRWRGTATGQAGAARVVDLRARCRWRALTAWRACSRPRYCSHGKLQRLTEPRVAVEGDGTLAERRLTGRLALRSAAIALQATGAIDLGDQRVPQSPRRRPAAPSVRAVPQHDGAGAATARQFRRTVRDRAVRIPPRRRTVRVRSDRLRGCPCGRRRAAVARARDAARALRRRRA